MKLIIHERVTYSWLKDTEKAEVLSIFALGFSGMVSMVGGRIWGKVSNTHRRR